jgi:PrcB C-terminal
MKKILVLLVMVVSFFACTPTTTSAIKECGAEKKVAFTTYNYCTFLKEKSNELKVVKVTSQENFQAVFEPCVLTAVFPAPFVPSVNFTTHILVGVLAGAKPTAGYAIKIESVVENDCELVLFYSETSPTAEQNKTQAITYPQDFVMLPTSTKPIMLKKVTRETNFVIVN